MLWTYNAPQISLLSFYLLFLLQCFPPVLYAVALFQRLHSAYLFLISSKMKVSIIASLLFATLALGMDLKIRASDTKLVARAGVSSISVCGCTASGILIRVLLEIGLLYWMYAGGVH